MILENRAITAYHSGVVFPATTLANRFFEHAATEREAAWCNAATYLHGLFENPNAVTSKTPQQLDLDEIDRLIPLLEKEVFETQINKVRMYSPRGGLAFATNVLEETYKERLNLVPF